jgi:hypothetical protein
VIIGLISTLFNSSYNYLRSPVAVSDVGRLLHSLCHSWSMLIWCWPLHSIAVVSMKCSNVVRADHPIWKTEEHYPCMTINHSI